MRAVNLITPFGLQILLAIEPKRPLHAEPCFRTAEEEALTEQQENPGQGSAHNATPKPIHRLSPQARVSARQGKGVSAHRTTIKNVCERAHEFRSAPPEAARTT